MENAYAAGNDAEKPHCRIARQAEWQPASAGTAGQAGAPHETRECLLDNVSASGARVRLEAPLDKGRTVMLGFHELRVYGTVSWCRNGECGIRFDSKIEQEDMEGFLWITRNPEEYQRICRESSVHDWSLGIGD